MGMLKKVFERPHKFCAHRAIDDAMIAGVLLQLKLDTDHASTSDSTIFSQAARRRC